MNETLLNTVSAFGAAHGMFPENGLILAAVSGGADSMCMLYLLAALADRMGFHLAAAHYNHCLRGAESDGDAAFVADFCLSAGIPCYCGSGDVRAYAAFHHCGIEAAARTLRYGFLQQTAEAVGAVRIATAHTADDNAETVLMNMARGSGLKGLCGIPPVRGSIIRPILSLSRAQVAACLAGAGIPHREDSSNACDDYARNRVRHTAVPVLKTINSDFCGAVTTMTALLAEDEEYLSALADDFLTRHTKGGRLPAAELAALPRPVASRVVRAMAGRQVSAVHVADVLRIAAGDNPSARADLPGISVRREYGALIFGAPDPGSTFTPRRLLPGDCVSLPEAGVRVFCESDIYPEKIHKSFNTFLFKSDQICDKLWVRPRTAGDSIDIGGRGTKSLKKLFIEKKIPVSRRELVPVLADACGPLAVFGLGRGTRALPEPGAPVWKIRFEEISRS